MTDPVRRDPASRRPGPRLPGWSRDPIAEFDDLFGRIGSLLESTVGGALPATEAWAPPADVSETDEAFLIEADLPGVERDDIDIELSERELVISGELRERERTGTLRRTTRRTGRFEYRAVLPGDIDAEGVSATLKEGVLTVSVPKAERTKPRHIRIAAGD